MEQFYKQGEFTHDSSNPFLNFVSSVLNRAIIDATFVDEYNSGVYSKIISPNEIKEAYECQTYGIIKSIKVNVEFVSSIKSKLRPKEDFIDGLVRMRYLDRI